MPLAIIVRGPDNTEATLNDAQFKAAEAIIVKMMNQKLTAMKAERLIIERCTEAGVPLQFVPAVQPEGRISRSRK